MPLTAQTHANHLCTISYNITTEGDLWSIHGRCGCTIIYVCMCSGQTPQRVLCLHTYHCIPPYYASLDGDQFISKQSANARVLVKKLLLYSFIVCWFAVYWSIYMEDDNSRGAKVGVSHDRRRNVSGPKEIQGAVHGMTDFLVLIHLKA